MRILVVEDEVSFRQVLIEQMGKDGIEGVGVGTAEEALALLPDGGFDILLTDLRLPDREGVEILRAMREQGIDIPALLMTAYASVSTAVSALQAGAADYIIKPARVPDLIRRLRQIHELDQLKRENQLLRKIIQQEPGRYWFPDTADGHQIKQMLGKVSRTDLTVLITGESGTGKGMTARLIHSLSARADKPFIPVNCGAIPETLVESELFGHVKGAFTGADKVKDGLFVGASGGTLFLDEIGELPLSMQVKLLHAIEEKVVRPLGGSHSRKTDVRIIAATNRNLEQMVSAGTFRMDLYYRLNIFEVAMPPLRQQMSVFAAAVEFILARYRANHQMDSLRIDPEAEALMRAYQWPGNLRELENVLERAVLLCEDNTITKWDLPPSVSGASAGMPAMTEAAVPIDPDGSLKDQVASYERKLILSAIQAAGGDRRIAARNLGLGLSTLYRKLEEGAPPAEG
ncbi:sigma-54-dependent transcriptional regulator [Azospirillum sp. sgz301742]